MTYAQSLNLRAQTYLTFDSAELLRSNSFEFKGKLLSSTRHLASTFDNVPTWNALPHLNGTTTPGDVENAALAYGLKFNPTATPNRFTTSSEYDALHRVLRSVAPDESVTAPVYNRANFLERTLVTAGGATH